jgi:hypothetical protein
MPPKIETMPAHCNEARGQRYHSGIAGIDTNSNILDQQLNKENNGRL